MTDLTKATGVYTIAPTPFEADGRIDWNSIDSMVDFYEQMGCTGITVLGVMGEAPKLDQQEAMEVAKRVIKRTKLPVIAGVSAPGFAAMRAMTAAVMDAGGAGVMIAPLHTLRTDDQITTYFKQASEAIGADVPWVLQDFPLTFGTIIANSVIKRIVNETPSCVMLKHEDWPGLEKITALRAWQADGSLRPFSILCGNGALFIDLEMGRGADGAMTGYGFPDMLADVIHLVKSGDKDAAHDLYDAHLPLIRYEHQSGVGLAVRKYILMKRGAIKSDAQRKPAAPFTAPAKAEVEFLLKRVGRRDKRAANL